MLQLEHVLEHGFPKYPGLGILLCCAYLGSPLLVLIRALHHDLTAVTS